ncbi:sigma-70 family RNA polymerase sigma factor [Actinoplanes sp. DH11]|uniref:sigma-70 family RNA polymerase sigma factor n=1 Tax=Actinoplanes sp. DH11 TaxID=2857011 RepID=UPI001E6411BE|nr:sigma-70 family RNA polymerase sigma factor [Actinoplanes sp. DH11]
MSTGGSGAGRHARLGDSGGPGAVTENRGELTDLVLAARAGDRRAAEALMAAHLPMLYRIVGRALEGHADVDDVVQETVLRAHRDLPALRTPASFRSWLVAIAMRQISSRLRSWQLDRDRTTSLDDATHIPDPDAEFADVTILRLGLSAQRRHVAQAARWLDPDDQELVGLWWQELTGRLDRAEVVAALGIGSAHARVRIQRMRHQLELGRHLVAALEAEPMCPELEALTAGWNGMPDTRWRKRFARHLRDCERCGPLRSGLVPVERLVLGSSLVLLPAAGVLGAGKVAGVLGGGAGTAAEVLGAGKAAGAGWISKAAGLKAAAVVAIGAAVSGGVFLAQPEAPHASQPAVSASPAGSVPLGPATLRPAASTGQVVALDAEYLVVAAGVPAVAVTVVPGIADSRCVSMRATDGRYVRHASFQLQLSRPETGRLFRQDATFCARPGAAAGTVRFTSSNYPDRFVRVRGGQLRLDPQESGTGYVAESTFVLAGA